MKNYSSSCGLYSALCDTSPAERLNIVKQANLDIQDEYGYTALMWAAKYGQTAIVDLLIKAGANKNIKDNEGHTALMLAACNNHKDIVGLLIKAGANKNIKDKYGHTALMLAAEYGQTAIVDSLIEAGANKDIQDEHGHTALMWATHYGYKNIVNLLSIKDIKQKLAESEQKNANLTKQVNKLEAQIAWNKFQDKKREQKRMREVLFKRKYRGI